MNSLKPRPGLLGQWDSLIGPGASSKEQLLIIGVAITAALGVAMYARAHELAWTGWQWAVVIILALDLFGGVVANATLTARRWYHRPGQTRRQHFVFVAVHLAQLVLFAYAFLGGDWISVFIAYGYLLLAALMILNTPPDLLRPITYAAYIGALGVSLYLIKPPAGVEWFLPILYFKLLVSHLGMSG